MDYIGFMSKSKLINLAWFIIAFFVLFYVGYTFFFSVNFPFQDDIMLIDFINNAIKNPNVDFTIFINELFRVDNDHLMLVPRLVALVDYLLTNSLHFKAYILIACLLTILILYFFYQEFKSSRSDVYYFLPVVFFFLQPQYYEVSNWALTGLQHTFLVVIMFLSLNCIRQNKLYLGVFFAILAVFTHGNGFFVFVILSFYLLFHQKYKEIIFVIIGFLFSIATYYHFYRIGNDTKILKNLKNFFVSIFGLLGGINMGMLENDLLLSIVVGTFAMLVFLYFFVLIVLNKEHSQKNIFMVAVFLFAILTIMLISFARSWSGITIGSRYQFYSALVIICVYLLILSNISLKFKKIFFLFTLGYSVFFSGHTFWKYTRINHYYKIQLQSDAFNWQNNKIMFCVDSGFVKLATPILEKSQNSKVWEVESAILKNELLKQITTADDIDIKVLIEKNNTQIFEARRSCSHSFISTDFPLNSTMLDNHFLVLFNRKSSNIYLNALEKLPNTKVSFFKTGNFFRQGSRAGIKAGLMQKGIYDIYFLNNTSKKMYRITRQFTVL